MMQTLSIFPSLFNEYINKIKQIGTDSPKEWRESINSLYVELKNKIDEHCAQYPELLQLRVTDSEEKDISTIAKRIAENSLTRYSLSGIPYSFVQWKLQDKNLCIPTFIPIANPILLNCCNQNSKSAYDLLNEIVFNILIQIPYNKISLHIVDTEISGALGRITSNINESIYNNSIVSTNDALGELLANLKKELIERITKYDDIATYNEHQQNITIPYKILIFATYPSKLDNYAEELSLILQKGIRAGIYPIVLNYESQSQIETLIDKNVWTRINSTPSYSVTIEDIGCPHPIINDNELAKLCFKNINNQNINNEEELSEKDYTITYGDIVVPVGFDENKDVVTLTLNGSKGHVHTFIIGKSGSGKSVLLHNILYQVISKYSPEDVQLYLFDMKLGGVEFVAYKDVPHIESLLVDDNDPEVTLSILHDLYKKMQQRGRILREEGVEKIDEYNQRHPEAKLPQILVAIDECHVLFSTANSHKTQMKINDVVRKIATEGRSQGVRLILATQTLANTDIPQEILGNISDCFIFNSTPTDSNRLVDGTDRYTQGLPCGRTLYCFEGAKKLLTTQYTPREEFKQQIERAILKAKDHKKNTGFYYSGRQDYVLSSSIIEETNERGLHGFIGCHLQLDRHPVSVSIKRNIAENVLLFGVNDAEQTTRVTMNLLASMVILNQKSANPYKIIVFDCFNNEHGSYYEQLMQMEQRNLCKVITNKERGRTLYQLSNDIEQENTSPTILFILGQERFRELKYDMDIPVETKVNTETSNDIFGGISFASPTKNKDFDTYKKALSYILDNGAEQNVHVVLQLNKPSNLLFEEYQSPRSVLQKFAHIIMLHCDDMVAKNLCAEDIHIEELNTDEDRLRAIYYQEETDKYFSFTPFKMVDITNL